MRDQRSKILFLCTLILSSCLERSYIEWKLHITSNKCVCPCCRAWSTLNDSSRKVACSELKGLNNLINRIKYTKCKKDHIVTLKIPQKNNKKPIKFQFNEHHKECNGIVFTFHFSFLPISFWLSTNKIVNPKFPGQ